MLRFADANGNPVKDYQASVRAVDPDTNATLSTVLFDWHQSQNPAGAALGTALSTPADATGASWTANLMLLDAPHNVRFRLQFFFDAFSDAEEAMLCAYDESVCNHTEFSESFAEVLSAASATVFRAENARELSVAHDPASDTALGVTVGGSNRGVVVRYEQPLASAWTNTSQEYFRLPQSVAQGFMLVEMSVASLNGATLSAASQAYHTEQMLASRSCLFWNFELLIGSGCTATEALGTTDTSYATFTNAAAVAAGARDAALTASEFGNTESAFLPTVPGTPMWHAEVGFGKLAWREEPPGVSTAATDALALSAGTQAVRDFGASAVTSVVTLNDKPASITLLNEPPATVAVGEPFLVRVLVRIASGAALRGVSISASLVQPYGATVGAFDFLAYHFSQKMMVTGNAEPALDAATSGAVTDKHGVARLVLALSAGATGDQRALQFATHSAASVTSPKTSVFTVSNPITTVELGDFEKKRTGLNGVGDPSTLEVTVEGQPVEAFPIYLDLPDLDVNVAHSSFARSTISRESALDSLAFRVFAKEDLEQILKDNARVAELQAEA